MNHIRRALSDTYGHFKTLIGAAIAVLISLIALFLWKGQDMVIEEVPYVVVALVGALAGVVTMFVWNLIAAPFRIQRDRADQAEQRLSEIQKDYPVPSSVLSRYEASVSGSSQIIDTAADLTNTLRSLVHHSRPDELSGAIDAVLPILLAILPDKSGEPPRGARVQTNWNTVYQLFSVPMRVAPKVTITNLPKDCNAEIKRVTKYGFEVSFLWPGPIGQTRPIPSFSFKADARL